MANFTTYGYDALPSSQRLAIGKKSMPVFCRANLLSWGRRRKLAQIPAGQFPFGFIGGGIEPYLPPTFGPIGFEGVGPFGRKLSASAGSAPCLPNPKNSKLWVYL